MMFKRKEKVSSPEKHDKAAVSNWSIGADGSLEPTPGSCRYIPANDGTYELDYIPSGLPLGILLETNSVGNYAIVKGTTEDCAEVARKVVAVGDVLVSVNKHQMLREDFSDVITFLEMLREGELGRRLRFLNPKRCPVAVYAERVESEEKSHKDMFGFSRSAEYLQKERQFKATRVQIDAQRDLDWVEYLKSIGGPDNLKPSGMFRPSPELKTLVRRGIPVAFRALLWPKLSLADKYKLKYPLNYYQELLNRKEELPSKVEIDIEKDIDRTFPEHDYYGCGGGSEVLRRVLTAHALHNPTIGYCQSLNFVAGMMLLFMQEEDAFWLFITVIDTLLPHDYYSATMVGTYIDQFVFAHIIQTRLEKVHAVLEGAALQIPLVTVQWFMCVYVNALPPETALRVWDMFLNEGPKVLFRVAVALFKLHEKQLIQAKDPGEVYNILKGMGKNVIDADVLIAAGYRNYIPPRRPKNVIYASAQRAGAGVQLGPEHTIFRPQASVRDLGSHKTRKARYSTYTGWIAAQVPAMLTGIGLGHLGPKTVDENDAAVDGDSPSPSPSGSDAVSTVELLSRNIFEVRNKVLGEYCSLAGVTSPELSVCTTPVTSSPAPMTSRIKKTMRLSKVRDYRSFSRLDLEKWRAQFRPEVEERFRTMEAAREQWREKDKEAKKDRDPVPTSSVAKLNAGNLDARRNRDESPEIRNNINSDPECDDENEDIDDDDAGAPVDLCFYNERPYAYGSSSSSASSSCSAQKPFRSSSVGCAIKESEPLQSPVGYSLADDSQCEIWPDEDGRISSMGSPSVWTGQLQHEYSSDEEEAAYETEEIDTTAVAYRNPRIVAESSNSNNEIENENDIAVRCFSSPGYITSPSSSSSSSSRANGLDDVSNDDMNAPLKPLDLPVHLRAPIRQHPELSSTSPIVRARSRFEQFSEEEQEEHEEKTVPNRSISPAGSVDSDSGESRTWKHSPSVHHSAAIISAAGAPVSSLAGTGANKQLRRLLMSATYGNDEEEEEHEESDFELPEDEALEQHDEDHSTPTGNHIIARDGTVVTVGANFCAVQANPGHVDPDAGNVNADADADGVVGYGDSNPGFELSEEDPEDVDAGEEGDEDGESEVKYKSKWDALYREAAEAAATVGP